MLLTAALILPRTADAQLVIRLNLPALQLEVVDSGRVVLRLPVAVGESAYQSRTGRFMIRRITWDPTWVPPSDEPWAARDSVMGPGGPNPMGVVKLALGGTYYIHGTPDPGSVGSPASHGCIRLRNRDAARLARYLEAATGTPDSGRDPKGATPHQVALARAVPVTIRYQLVERRGRRLLVHRDIYGLRTAGTDSAAAALILSGPPTPNALTVARRLAELARRGSLDLPADSVRASTDAPEH